MVTCSVLDLGDELDIVLGHEWCRECKIVISYKGEEATFVHEDRPYLLRFDDSHPQSSTPTFSLCSIR